MRHFIFCFGLIMYSTFYLVQQKSKADLLQDIRFLNQALIPSHPTQLKYPTAQLNQTLLETIEKNTNDSIDASYYELCLRNAVAAVRCAHTYITKPPFSKKKQKTFTFPFQLFASNDSLYVADEAIDTSKTLVRNGSCIESINGMDAANIVRALVKYQPADGTALSFGYRLINLNSRALIGRFYGQSDSSFRVQFKSGSNVLTEVWNNTLRLKSKVNATPKPKADATVLKGSQAYFKLINETTGYLKIEHFSNRYYKSFYKKVMRTLQEKNCKHLIIDVKDNLGGNRYNAACLLAYLIKEPAHYNIIRPNSKIIKYLNFSNACKFMLSYLYYDLGHFYQRRKNENRKVLFKNTIRPHRQTFNGNVVVLVNGYSSSSSVILANNLKYHGHSATFVGEQPMGGESGINGGSYPQLKLPKSGARLQTSTYAFEFDNAANNPSGLVPNITIKKNYQNFWDETLELNAALNFLKTK